MTKYFICDQCGQEKHVLRKLCQNGWDRYGFLCDDCWSLVRKRLQQLFFREIKIKA